jgi:hypothetical protein
METIVKLIQVTPDLLEPLVQLNWAWMNAIVFCFLFAISASTVVKITPQQVTKDDFLSLSIVSTEHNDAILVCHIEGPGKGVNK